MRSVISLHARNCMRNALRQRYVVPGSSLRWSSSEARKWTTPLAKQLSEAITVWCSCVHPFDWIFLTIFTGYRSNSFGSIHADVLNIRPGWILYVRRGRTRPVRAKGRFHYIAGNFPDIWGAHWNMVPDRMDGTRTKESGCRAGRDWTWKRDFDG
jgi:hypothetical protein